MPYITTEKVKEIRNELKKEFPQFKFSVRREHYSSVRVAIVSGPLDLGSYTSVNHYYVKDHYKNQPEICNFLLKIVDIIGREQRELVYDGDYGSVPTYYYSISIGNWDREYVLK